MKTGFCSFIALFHANSNDWAKKAILPPDWEQQIRTMIGFILSNEQAHCRRSPAIRQQHCCCRSCIVIQVGEYLLNNCRVFDGVTRARYLLLGAKTPWKRVRLTLGLGTKATSLEMTCMDALMPRAHGCAGAVKSSGSNITWVVPLCQGVRLKRLLLVQLIADLAIASQRQAFRGYCRPRNVTAQTFQLRSFIGFGGNPGMQ